MAKTTSGSEQAGQGLKLTTKRRWRLPHLPPCRVTHLVSKDIPMTWIWGVPILPGQQVATVVTHLLPELSELSQREVYID